MSPSSNRKLEIFRFWVFTFGFSVLGFGFAHAQLLPPPLSLTSSPSSPSPGGVFTVTASTPTFDKEAAFFDWTVDGKAQPEISGLGKNTAPLTAKAVGVATRISVRVARPNGETAAASLAVIPSELSLPWIAQTTAPKWYRGKAMPTSGSQVAISAVPRIILGGAVLNPDNLIYRWSIDNRRNALVGAGKRVFRFTAANFPGATHQIDVAVEDIDRRIRKEGRVLVETANPRAVLYYSSPLGGTEFRAAAGLETGRRGLIDVKAEPFFFPQNLASSLTYAWTALGQVAAPSSLDQSLLTFDAGRLPAGAVPIATTIRSTSLFLPSAAGSFNLFLR